MRGRQDFAHHHDDEDEDPWRWFCAGALKLSAEEQRWLGSAHVPERVGALKLSRAQRRAAERAERAVRRYGGAILADATGLGKTRVALALLRGGLKRRERARALLCVPARLKPMWERALLHAAQGAPWRERVTLLSHHALSRHGVKAWGRATASQAGAVSPSWIVIDEAHRFCTPHTQRYDAMSRLARHATATLCVTATPIRHGVEDLRALLDLFITRGWEVNRMGRARGVHLDPERLDERALEALAGEVIVRRVQLLEASDRALKRPRQRIERVDYEPGPRERWLWRHVAQQARELELALFGSKAPSGLFTELLCRRWESGVESLRLTLDRLVVLHDRALRHHAATGRCPSIAALREAFEGGGQESFAFMLEGAPSREEGIDIEAIRRDLARLKALARRVEAARQEALHGDGGRLRALATLCAERLRAHKVLCFTSSREAAEGCFEALCRRLGAADSVGLITGAGARATGLGRIKAQLALERFAPIGQECQGIWAPSEQLRVLVATDCIAEGVNLQDCAHVVLLDLPYTPLGLTQRVGRLSRPGGPHEEVVVLWLRPRGWEDSLGMMRRLRVKADEAARAHLGYDEVARFLSDSSAAPRPRASATGEAQLLERLDRYEALWREAAAEVSHSPRLCLRPIHGLQGANPVRVAYLLVREGDEERGWRHGWWRVGAQGDVERRPWRFVEEMVRWRDRVESAPVQVAMSGEEERRWRDRFDGLVRARSDELRAIWWAPVALKRSSATGRALNALRTLSAPPEAILTWLGTAPLHIGLERELQDQLTSGASPDALALWLQGELEAISGERQRARHAENQPAPRVEWLSALLSAM